MKQEVAMIIRENVNSAIIQEFLNNGGTIQKIPTRGRRIKTFGPKTAGCNLVRAQIVDAMQRPEILENK